MSIKLECQIDWTEYNKAIKGLQELTEREVVIGYDDMPHGDSGLPNSVIGLFLENGVRGVSGGMSSPPRPVIYRSGFILADDIDRESLLLVNNSMLNKQELVNRDLKAIGDKGISSVQESIDRQGFAPLKESTIKYKEARGALFPRTVGVDTGELYESVIYTIK